MVQMEKARPSYGLMEALFGTKNVQSQLALRVSRVRLPVTSILAKSFQKK